MADPSLGAAHLMALGRIMELLGSSNLLTPDLEGQLANLDTEQEVRFLIVYFGEMGIRGNILMRDIHLLSASFHLGMAIFRNCTAS